MDQGKFFKIVHKTKKAAVAGGAGLIITNASLAAITDYHLDHAEPHPAEVEYDDSIINAVGFQKMVGGNTASWQIHTVSAHLWNSAQDESLHLYPLLTGTSFSGT
jgi:hypothetical protein